MSDRSENTLLQDQADAGFEGALQAALQDGPTPALPSGPAPAPRDWRAAMEAVAEEDGYLDPLGAKHWAFFAETGTTLLVTFERADHLRERPGCMPAAWELAKAKGWSLLTLLSEGETFFRAPEVWRYFDRLVDDAFFDDFDQVLFYGAGACGYAAAAYVVAAPGARALLVSPRATLDPGVAGWDRRHLAARRLDFSSRYGYAPDMTEGADRVWVIHDPLHAADAAHAALFRRPWTTVLNARFTGANTEAYLMHAGSLSPAIEAAVTGSLSPAGFARHWRSRRGSNAWLKALHGATLAAGRKGLETRLLRTLLARPKVPRFARRYEGTLDTAGDQP